MKKIKLYSLLSFILAIIFPVFTIINFIFSYYNIDTYFYIINLNSSIIDLAFIKYAYSFWKICTSIVLIIKILLLFLLPIFSYIKKYKTLYIIQFIIVFFDSFLFMTLSNNYVIMILNILHHALLLYLLCMTIKHIDPY